MNPKQINTQNYSQFEGGNYEQRNYEYKRVATLKTYNNCISFAFNTNNTILFVGQINGSIKALGFNSHTKLIQTIFTFTQLVVCLIWRKKSNSLISLHEDKIIIWNQLTPLQILGRENFRCMILNEAEDLLVSGSIYYNIRFWKKQSNGWINSQKLQTSVSAAALSFNTSQNKLILCGAGFDKFISSKTIKIGQQLKLLIFQTIVLVKEFASQMTINLLLKLPQQIVYRFIITIKRIINFWNFKEFKLKKHEVVSIIFLVNLLNK